uniref:Uncharacterized protein n=1 Tax=Arundo donax TaxID=35708 RepID=A0A0A8Z123_ARUDO
MWILHIIAIAFNKIWHGSHPNNILVRHCPHLA